MYLTVQRVHAPHRGTGINGALYLHGVNRTDPTWNPPDLRQVVNENLGHQAKARVDLPPGGNAVRAYLDIVGPDDIDVNELRDALRRLQRALRDRRQHEQYGPIAVEFSVTPGDSNPEDCLRELSNAALALFQQPTTTESPAPLVINVTHDAKGWHFTLSNQSEQRLRQAFGEVQIAGVNVPDNVAADFRTMYGELYPHAVEWVTSKPRSELLALGGVQFVQGAQVLWEWPRQQRKAG